jgi:cytochrome c oxidase assembly factor CtaG
MTLLAALVALPGVAAAGDLPGTPGMDGMPGMSGASAVAHMAAMGLLVSVLAPALVLLGRGRWLVDRLALPGLVALPAFTVLHAAVTLGLDGLSAASAALGTVLLLVGAVAFWSPVLGERRRLADPARAAYLFIAAPVLDLPAVWLVAEGRVAEGLAMVVGMLPVGGAAIGVTWRWVTMEERQAEQVSRT